MEARQAIAAAQGGGAGEAAEEELPSLRREDEGMLRLGDELLLPSEYDGTGDYDDDLDEPPAPAPPPPLGAFAVFVNVETLSAAQERRLSEAWGGVPVLDRFSLILLIFRSRAVTKSAKLQLELARLRYDRSRLIDASAGHAQQAGATAMRSGPGETQLELGRRTIDARITRLQRMIEEEARSRTRLQRARRAREENAACRRPVVALVGYTNAGKSLLHSCLTGGDGERARDALFASLETQTRAGRLPDGSE
eukprot:6258112-Prymnesium_polylepis.1